MPCERGTVKLEGIYVDVVLPDSNPTAEKQCLQEDNPENVRYYSSMDEGNGDIVALMEPDLVYPYGFLARLVKHFADPGVVAVSGSRTDDLLAPIASWWSRPMLKGACAFRRSAWAGSLDATANQGKYVFESRAVVRV